MNDNRKNFLIHLVAAFVCVLLFAAHVGMAIYESLLGVYYAATLAGGCAGLSVWLFVRMILHCIEAVGREVELNRRRAKQAQELAAAMNSGFERALNTPPNRIYRRAA